MFCGECGLAQLRHNFDLDALFRETYGYRSGINQSMRQHLADLVAGILSTVELQSGDLILDIGSNDGTLLKNYMAEDCGRMGIDPTIAQFEEYYPDDIVTVADFFGRDVFDRAAGGRKAKIITSIAMMYDLPDPNVFVNDIANCLAPDGLWVFEQSYVGLMLSQNAFDTICHEHLEYYGVRQIERLLSAHGLRIADVIFNDVNGGSFQIHACHDAASFKTTAAVTQSLAAEMAAGLDTISPYLAFRDRVIEFKTQLSEFVKTEHAASKTFIVYGASTKGNVLMQYCDLDRRYIRAAADRNPEKWGRRMPGTEIPIISEATARSQDPDYFLVLPWHFKQEFLVREEAFLENGGKIIFPLPELTICTRDNIDAEKSKAAAFSLHAGNLFDKCLSGL